MQAIIQPTHHTIFNKMVFEFYMFICINFYDSPHDIKLMAIDSLLERRMTIEIEQIHLSMTSSLLANSTGFFLNTRQIPTEILNAIFLRFRQKNIFISY